MYLIIVETWNALIMDEKRAIAALGALAQETRLALFRLLVTAGPAGLRAGALGQLVGGAAKPIGEHSNGRSTGQEDPAGRRVEEVAQNNG